MSYLEKLKNKKRLPHELPKLPKGVNGPYPRTAKTAKSPFGSKDSTKGRHISENEGPNTPPPEPAGMGPEYEKLWMDAWTLANQIDDYKGGIYIEDRRTKMPELDRMRAELERLEKAGAITQINQEPVELVKQPEISKVQETNPDSCPARCKVSGGCYGRAYFDGKSGKAQECTGPCQWRTKPEKQQK